MKCRVCGFDFDEDEIAKSGCTGCKGGNCNKIHCPNCGYGNTPDFEDDFEFMNNLKKKLAKKFNSNDKQ